MITFIRSIHSGKLNIYLNSIIIFFAFSFAAWSIEQQAIQKELDSNIAEYKIPGGAASIITPDNILSAVSGLIKLGDTIKAVPDAKFHIGSNTKAVTAFMIMKEVERGNLKLESSLAELFPEIKDKIKGHYRNKTIKDLLSHHAGVRPFTGGLEVALIPGFKGSITEKRQKFAEYVLGLEPVINDTSYTYSNAGYALAAAILERATGKSWEELLAETMDSLGIEYYIGFPNKESVTAPWGHWIDAKGMVPLPPGHFYSLIDVLAPAGDISMSIGNYSRWLQINLQGLLGNSKYLRQDSYQKMHFINKDYSFGWINFDDTDYGAISTHDGSAGTFYCHAVIVPSLKAAIAVIANSADEKTMKGLYELRNRLVKIIKEK